MNTERIEGEHHHAARRKEGLEVWWNVYRNEDEWLMRVQHLRAAELAVEALDATANHFIEQGRRAGVEAERERIDGLARQYMESQSDLPWLLRPADGCASTFEQHWTDDANRSFARFVDALEAATNQMKGEGE